MRDYDGRGCVAAPIRPPTNQFLIRLVSYPDRPIHHQGSPMPNFFQRLSYSLKWNRKPRRAKILFVDDEKKFRDEFLKRHSDSLTVTVCDFNQINNNLNQDQYDLIVCDLYQVNRENIATALRQKQVFEHTPLFEQLMQQQEKDVNDEVQRLVGAVGAERTRLQAYVARYKTPEGFQVKTAVKASPRNSDTPILLYTREGMHLAAEDMLEAIENEGHGWMFKSRGSNYEFARMQRVLRENAGLRKWELALLSSIFGGCVANLIPTSKVGEWLWARISAMWA
jgi:CheY-like chemotaxis protein